MVRERCPVLANDTVAPGHRVLRLRSRRIAREARPGRFVQLLCADGNEPLLPRPFSFLSASGGSFELLYHVVGKGTALLSRLGKGDELWAVGPLGNGFTVDPGRGAGSHDVALVGGGVGIPPLVHLADTLVASGFPAKRLHVFLGARSEEFLLCRRTFRELGVHLHLATDDGSRGRKGFVTAPLEDYLKAKAGTPAEPRVFTCGPNAMMRAVGALAARYGAPCEVSVEVPMACGFGACLGCAIKVRAAAPAGDPAAPDYRYAVACCEGPVFDAGEVVWE